MSQGLRVIGGIAVMDLDGSCNRLKRGTDTDLEENGMELSKNKRINIKYLPFKV